MRNLIKLITEAQAPELTEEKALVATGNLDQYDLETLERMYAQAKDEKYDAYVAWVAVGKNPRPHEGEPVEGGLPGVHPAVHEYYAACDRCKEIEDAIKAKTA